MEMVDIAIWFFLLELIPLTLAISQRRKAMRIREESVLEYLTYEEEDEIKKLNRKAKIYTAAAFALIVLELVLILLAAA